MWIFIAQAGFFSVVQCGEPDQLAIRARVKEDLIRLRDLYLPSIKIIGAQGTDYAWRSFASKADFSGALVKAVAAITFQNFKMETGKVLGNSRAATYGEVWRVLRGLQRPDRSE